MTLVDIAAALLRTTLATSAAALAAWALLAWLRIDAPRIHRIAWLLVIAQGWLFFPLTIEIETAQPLTTKRAAGFMPAGITEQANPLSTDAARGREPFATGGHLLLESPQSQKAPDPLPLPIITIASWLLGAVALTAISLRRYLQVLRALPLGSAPDDPQWQAEWHAARTAAQLRRQPVDLRITTSLGPLLHWAPWAYLILVPRPLWITLAAPQRQAILRHELAHLRRDDLWKSLAIRVLALPQWFNPFACLATRRFDEAAEWACDDAAAATAASRLTFAESLLQSAEYAAAPFPASAPAARGVLTRRIHRLVSPRFKEESKMKLLLVPTLLAMAAVAQTVRIESVVAKELPVTAAKAPKASSDRHSGPPLSQEQMDFDRLAKEFENFARADYVIEPPDILSIESEKLLPKSPHLIETFDVLRLRVTGALPEQPIDDNYNVDADGAVNLGPTYGRIAVVGQTIKEAEDAILAQLSKILTDVDVSVSLLASSSAQAITGQHLVAMDGRVNFGAYGSVYVTGMTLKEARAAIELKLAEHLDDPKVSVDVLAYNSKVVYLILQDGHGRGDVSRTPLPYPFSSNMNVGALLKTAKYPHPIDFAAAKMTLCRPAPNGVGAEMPLPVTWDVARGTPTATSNYPLLPGDRVFVTPAPGTFSVNVRPSTNRIDPPPASPATPVEESKRLPNSGVAINLKVIEDVADNLSEFRKGSADMIVADGKTFGAALRVLEKNSLVKITARERVVCAYGKNEPIVVELPIPNPTLKFRSRQSGATQVSVRPLGNATFAVKLEFHRKVEGQEVRESLELGMRLGESNVLECTGATTDESESNVKTYLLIGLLTTTGDPKASAESPPDNVDSSMHTGDLNFVIEPRFLPNLRGPKKAESIKKGR